MKIIQLSAILVLFVATYSADATRQARDPLVWKGETVYPENGPTIWGAFPENKEIIQKPKFDFESTASRGYDAKWEIKEDALYLMSLEGKIDGKKVGVSDVFADKTAPILASWFSGTVIIPRGKEIGLLKEGEIRYVYTKETHLIIEKGKVVKVEEKTFDPENTPVCFAPSDTAAASRIWRSPSSSLQQRADAVMRLIPKGTSKAQVQALLGRKGTWSHYHGPLFDAIHNQPLPDHDYWRLVFKFPGGGVGLEFEPATGFGDRFIRAAPLQPLTSIPFTNAP